MKTLIKIYKKITQKNKKEIVIANKVYIECSKLFLFTKSESEKIISKAV